MLSSVVLVLAYIIHIFSLHVRRLHDQDLSGWWAFLFLVPLVGLVIFFVLLLSKGDLNDNEWGQPLKGTEKFFETIFNRKF